jgi:tetratricopeptide (TPR) repeat protein
MTSGRIAIAAIMLFHLFARSLDAQITPQTRSQPVPQTKEQLTKALQKHREKKDLHGEALTLLQLGIAETGLGNVDSARSNLAEASKKMRAQGDPFGAWFALNLLSQLEVMLGRPAEAILHIEKTFAVLNEAKASTAPLNLKAVMAFGSASGFPPEVVQMLAEPSAGLVKPILFQHFLEPVTHDLHGSVLTQLGQLDKAEAALKAATGSGPSTGLYDFSIEEHWGDLRFRQQRYDEARSHYVKALNALSTIATIPLAEQQVRARVYDRLVRVETITGHPEDAKLWLDKARALAKNNTPGR